MYRIHNSSFQLPVISPIKSVFSPAHMVSLVCFQVNQNFPVANLILFSTCSERTYEYNWHIFHRANTMSKGIKSIVIKPKLGKSHADLILLLTRLRLHMAGPFTKFEVSSVSQLSRCGDITRGIKFYNGSPDPDHSPFREDFSPAGWDATRRDS